MGEGRGGGPGEMEGGGRRERAEHSKTSICSAHLMSARQLAR